MLVLLAALACSDSPSDKADPAGSTETTPVPTTVPTTETTPSTETTPTTTSPTTPAPTGDCAPLPAAAIVDVTTAQPWRVNEVELTVTLGAPASVAVACTLQSDPAEVHLVEGLDVAESHVLRLAGLLAESTYDCVAAPTCPTSGGPAHAFSFTTGDEPPFFASITTTTYDPTVTGYALLNNSDDCTWTTQRLFVTDRDGRIRWFHQTPNNVGASVEFRWHGDDTFAWGGGWEPNSLGRPRLVDLYEGEIYDSAVALPDVLGSDFHHDGKMLPDGRLLTLEEVHVDDGGFGFDGFRVRRVDPVTNTVDFDYHSQRAFDEGELPGGFGDVWHANWVDIVDEVLYVSLCNLGWTVAIDVATGDWLWTFGADADFSLVDAGGAPLPSREFPQCEHGLEKVGDKLLVYDNGAFGRGFSRASEYQLDEATMTATLLWTWTEPDWYETTLGDVDYMPNGHVWIAAGHAECFSSNPGDRSTIYEIDPVTGDKLWELQYDVVEAMAYRSDHADGCALFANTSQCPALSDRLVELGPLLAP